VASLHGPPEPPRGQDEPPDTLTAINAVLRVFAGIVERDGLAPDDVPRIAALRRALVRLRDRLEAENNGR
jgi:hypothetical protein